MKTLLEKLKGIKEKNVKTLIPTVVSFVVFIAALYNHPVNAEHLSSNINSIVDSVFIIVSGLGSLYGIFTSHKK